MPRRSYKNKRLRKRWFVDARIGKSVPFIGGSGITFGSGSKAKRSLTTAVKQIVHKGIQPTQYKIFDGATSGTSMAHNTLYTLNLLGNIPRGDNWNNRNGDIIHLSCIELYLTMYSNIANALLNDVKFKYWVVRDQDEYLGGSDAISSGVGSSKFINTPNYVTQGLWDPKRVTVVASGTHTFKPSCNVGSTTQTPSEQKTDRVLICPDAKFTFETGTNFGKVPNYYLVICSSIYGGSTGTTVTGAIFVDGMIKFKNSQ